MTPSTNRYLDSSASNQVSESPFPDQVIGLVSEKLEIEEEQKKYSDSYQIDSPFQSIYELESEEGIVDPETEAVMEFLDELYDEEFDEAIYELINEADELYQNRFESEYYGNPIAQKIEAQRVLEAHFAPLVREAETLMEAIAEEVEQYELDTISEAEIETLVNQHQPQNQLSPSFEHFFGAIKKAAKKAWKAAKRGLGALGKLAIRKLKRLIKPVLYKVLKLAINKIPAKYRPLAKTLAKRLGLSKEVEEASLSEAGDEAIQDISEIQREFDEQVANLLFAKSEEEQEVAIAEYTRESEPRVTENPLEDLDRARAQFINQLNQLEEGEDPTPLVENFAPALLPILKTGIKLIGRPKIVKFLAKYLGLLIWKLIKKFLGKRTGKKFKPYVSPLSKAIVDAGLRLMKLETTPETEEEAAEAAILATVEDTMRQVAALPEYILDNQEMLEGYILEAFENAATANLPPVLSEETYRQRPELRETVGLRGTWVLQPLGNGKHYKYKKYTKIFDVNISPHIARTVNICCGTPLMVFLRDRLRLSPGKTIKARIHLYEAIPGTILSQICKQEKQVAGLGMRSAYSQLHPLTPEAAGMLLGQPGLGRSMPSKYLDHRPMAAVGQRFYYLEIPEMRPQMMLMTNGMSVAKHSSKVYVTLNFPSDKIRALIYLSEAQAQAIAMKLRQGAPMGMIVASLKYIFEYKLKTALSGNMCGHVKIIHGAVTPERSRGSALKLLPTIVRENLIQKLREWLEVYLSKYLQERKQDFIAATENLADGVTLAVDLNNPPGFPILRKALRGEPVSLYNMGFSEGMPDIQIQIIPGYYHD